MILIRISNIKEFDKFFSSTKERLEDYIIMNISLYDEVENWGDFVAFKENSVWKVYCNFTKCEICDDRACERRGYNIIDFKDLRKQKLERVLNED